jgi:hypothetical protein
MLQGSGIQVGMLTQVERNGMDGNLACAFYKIPEEIVPQRYRFGVRFLLGRGTNGRTLIG